MAGFEVSTNGRIWGVHRGAEKLESRLELLGRLDIGLGSTLPAALTLAKEELLKRIAEERASELAEGRWRDERFE